ncbi:hypothetical protein KEJ14_04635 [Candidatus Bathyarchaeota archaeon]|nr:hypothetical protein [Candidatus Bathyarchaeota archaeon]
MACFLVPMVLAIITTALQKASKGVAEKLKLNLLNALLWGGVILLAAEHAWHGEIVPWPPFLTAMATPSEMSVMLHEIAIVGTAMSVLSFAAWGAMLAVNYYMPKAITLRGLSLPKPAKR